MLRYILNNLAGYLRIRVEGYSPERFLNLCCYHGIFLWNLRPAKGAYEMNIRVRDFRRLRPMVRKSRAKVRITQKRGVPFFIHKYRGRKLFFTVMNITAQKAGRYRCPSVLFRVDTASCTLEFKNRRVAWDIF